MATEAAPATATPAEIDALARRLDFIGEFTSATMLRALYARAIKAEAALAIARFDLVTTHNLRATDLDVETLDAHISNSVPRDQLEWMTDNSKGIAAIDAAAQARKGGADAM